MPATSSVLMRRDGPCTRIVIDRPERHNALCGDTLTELLAALHRASDSDARVIALEGASRAFSTGLDLTDLIELRRRRDWNGFARLVRSAHDVVARLAIECPKPILALVNGPAAGAGLGLALACDVVIATPRATLGATQVRLGLHPDLGLTHTLAARCGRAIAQDLLWSGRVVDAHDAAKLRVVDRVVPPHAVEREPGTLAARLVDVTEAVVSSIKREHAARAEAPLRRALANEEAAQLAAFRTPECLERLEGLARRLTARAHARREG